MSSPDSPSDDGAASSADVPAASAGASDESAASLEMTSDPSAPAASSADEQAEAPAGDTDSTDTGTTHTDPADGADDAGTDDRAAQIAAIAALRPIRLAESPVRARAGTPSFSASDFQIPALTKPADVKQRKRHKRSWSQRLLLGLNCIVILGCFATAAGLLISRHYGNSLQKVELADPPNVTDPTSGMPVGPVSDDTETDPDGTTPSGGPVETFPQVDPQAKNFLITGADNNACIDPDSPFAGAFGDRETMGERSDTIMLMRVDPSTHRAAVLSFPRDLWVQIADRNAPNRINTAYVRDDPQRLIDTIAINFYLGVDHFIQVDFCAFKTIVDAVDGVTVPFKYPARDENTGLDVPTTGCYTFDGEHALAYVRSRHYDYMDESGKWKEDPAADLGRISRQQDFLRRVLSSALDKGLNPSVARGIIEAAQDYVVVDKSLTISRMLEFAGILADFEPGEIATYQIESYGDMIGSNSVQRPRIKGENMQAILNIFRGVAPLAGAPEQVFETTTDPDAPPSSESTSETTPLQPEESVIGIVPPDDMIC
jgi:LCP family protein required for cell wall assembly